MVGAKLPSTLLYESRTMIPENTNTAATEVDGRVISGGMWKWLCEFVGTGFSPDQTRKCKYYDKSNQRSCCIHFRDTLDVAVCDCQKE